LTHQKIDKTAAKKRVISLFQKVKLQEPARIFQSFPHELSGGQRQRVMIAMALSCEPSILIADEPTSALDVTIQRSILDLINELKSEMDGATIFISHDLKVVAEIADRVLVMQNGKIVEQGPIDQVFNHPKEEYTKRLLKDSLGLEPLQKSQKKEQQPILQIRNLQTWFSQKKSFFGKTLQHVKAVDGVSFEVFAGETLGLVGESGSGKTTLGRTLLHLQKPTGGEVIYNGQSLLEVPDNEWKSIRRDLQIIFQDPYSSLNPRQMIGPAIMEPMKVHGIGNNEQEREKLAKGLLQKVGLEETHFWRFPKEFSGGQRQRICIAKALAVQPRIIICDECVSALDVTVQAKILALLKQLQAEEKLTYLFISHDLSVIRQISDRVAVMQAGRIVELEEVADIYDNPKNDYTRQLIEAIPGRK
jgi:peptide/nickel transport system ATP-binding protein